MPLHYRRPLAPRTVEQLARSIDAPAVEYLRTVHGDKSTVFNCVTYFPGPDGMIVSAEIEHDCGCVHLIQRAVNDTDLRWAVAETLEVGGRLFCDVEPAHIPARRNS